MKERDKKEAPSIIEEINKRLAEGLSTKADAPTVEGIAEKIGIGRNVLLNWLRTDQEFSEALEILNTVQKEDPFKTGDDEDNQVNSMMVTILLMETRDRHNKFSTC